VLDLTDEEVERIEKLIQEYDVRITVLSPGIFKLPLSESGLTAHNEGRLGNTVKLDRELGRP